MAFGGKFTAGTAGGPAYEAEVVKGWVKMDDVTQVMNARAANGYRPAHVFEQNGNTVIIWERVR